MKKLPSIKHYPKKVFVRNFTYTVKFTDKITHYGDTDSKKKEIRIKKGMSERSTFITFIHELLHALSDEHKLDLKHDTVYALEEALAELLVDNFL